jgi:hypothetical protein
VVQTRVYHSESLSRARPFVRHIAFLFCTFVHTGPAPHIIWRNKREAKVIQQRLIVTALRLASVMALFLTAPRTLCSSSLPPACKSSDHAVSISQLDAAQTASTAYLEPVPTSVPEVEGTFHVYLRNDGPGALDHVCARYFLTDNRDRPRTVHIALSQPVQGRGSLQFDDRESCVKFRPSWQAYDQIPLDIHLRVGPGSIPLSGVITLSTDLSFKEEPDASAGRSGAPKHTTVSAGIPTTLVDCISTSKPLIRSVILLSSRRSQWFLIPPSAAFVVALLYLLFSTESLRTSLDVPMGGPQWSFGSSFDKFHRGHRFIESIARK